MKDKPEHRRPREKLLERGADVVQDYELFAILLGFGVRGRTVEQLSRTLANIPKPALISITARELLAMSGLGKAKVATILAALELGRRLYKQDLDSDIRIEKTEDILPLLKPLLRGRQEKIVALYLSASQVVLDTQVIAVGTSTMCIAHPRDIIWHGIVAGAVGIIIAHNHPSGSLEASDEDILFTRRLDEACDLVGFALLDHLIITKDGWSRIV